MLNGPEFLTIFNGETGGSLATASYVVPRGTVSDWGDDYGNRVDRFNATVAYLDGQRPSLVMARGYYTRTVLAAWNWRNGQFTNIWTFDTGHTGTPNPFAAYRGQGNHNLSVGDVDGDGKDEIMYGACAIDDDGTGLFTTGWGHGDALHMSDMDPDRPGLEVFQPHECPSCYGPNAAEFRDGRTGALIFGVQASGDIGRGLALDVDPRFRGYEMWASGGTGGMYSAQQSTPNAVLGTRGVQIAPTKPSINFGIWWDGDLLRELLDGTSITKWNWLAGNTTSLLSPPGVSSNNGTKATPNLSADIIGDWREEAIWRESGNSALRIYTTTIPTTNRIYTLMHDRQYREAIAWQNSGYNQPPHPGFFLGDGMAPPPTPNIVTSLSTLLGPAAPVFASIDVDAGFSANDFVTNDSTLVLRGTSAPDTIVTLTQFGVGVIGSTNADSSGNWAFDYSGTALPNGDTLFTATATDAGNQTGPSTTPPFRVTVDLIPPAAPVIVDVADQGSLVFTGTSEPGSTVAITLVGTGVIAGSTVDASGNWTVDYSGPPLTPGSHSFTATATDLAGNTGPESAAVTIDTNLAAPIITRITDDTGSSTTDGTTTDNSLVLTGTATAGHTISVKLLGVAVLGTTIVDADGQWSFDHTGTVLADGVYRFSASASNGVGTSASSPPFAVIVDTNAPTVVSVNRQNPTVATSSVASITFRVTLSEPTIGLDASDFTPVFSGGLSGSISDLVQTGANSFDVTIAPLTGEGTLRLDLNASGTDIADVAGNLLSGGFTGGQPYTRSLTGNGIWIQNGSGGFWANNANWLNGIVGAGVGSTADFTTLELVDDLVVNLDSPRTLGNIVFGDTDLSSPGSWIVDNGGSATNTLNLAVNAGSPSIFVNPLGLGAMATMSVPLTGNQGLTKLGTGTLLLTRLNTLTGAMNVSAGTLRIGTGGSAFAGVVNISSGGARLNIAGGNFTATGNLTVNAGSGSALIVDSGIASFAGLATNNTQGGLLRINGGTVTANSVTLPRSSDATPSFANGFVVTGGSTTISGPIGLGTNNSWGSMSVEGGSLFVNGVVTIGNQASGGRGGQMRVTNGTFTSTNTATGILMCRNAGNPLNTNNVATATFTGGVSTVERFTLGFDSTVTGGSTTITINGGALYLGSGGIVKNGAAGLATNLNFSSGLLGAKADWSTAVPINLPTNGNITFAAADSGGEPHNINFNGVLSGPGGFTKTGNGTLLLGAANTFTGAVTVNEGTLDVDGSLAAGPDLSVNSGGTLTGDGTINRGVVLGSGGTLRPGSTIPGSALTASSLAWNGGGSLAFELSSTSNKLALTGGLTNGGGGSHEFAFTSGPGLADGNTYTLATFGSTDLTVDDLTLSGMPAGLSGEFNVTLNSITFTVFGPPSIATQPENVTVLMGGTATFSVVAGGSRVLTYQWFKDNSAVAGATGATLTINNVQASNIGSYTVVVTNGAGSVTSNAATLSIAAQALVRHAPALNSAVLIGSLQQMLAQSVTLNGNASVTGDLLVPGTPNVVLNGSPDYGGTLEGSGSPGPSNYRITLNSNTSLGHVVRRTDPVSLPVVNAPPAPLGTRDVVLNSANQSVGDWATVRNLTLNGHVGQIAAPPGAYGDFTANGGSGFTLGIAGATQPAVYYFQHLTLNSGAQLQVVGPVVVVVGSGFNINSGVVGHATNKTWLTLNIYSGDVNLNSGATIYGYVTAPGGTVIINGNTQIVGGVACDRLTINSTGRLHLLAPPN